MERSDVMKLHGIVAGIVAAGTLASGTWAGPGGKGSGDLSPRRVTPPGGGVAGGGFEENFDSYKAGSTIAGQGGWEIWYSGGNNATVSGEQSSSAPNSLRDVAASDIVQRFGIDAGVWEFSIDLYTPSGAGGDGFVIMMNQYGAADVDRWSMQVRFSPGAKIVESQWDLAQLPLTLDTWVHFSAVIDLDNDSWDSFVDGVPLSTDLIWSDNGFAAGPGITSIAALDLWSEGATPFYYDNVSLRPAGNACYPDCDGDGELSFFDFLCYTNAFNSGDMYADCDGDGELSFFDFLCYTNGFNAGC
jgi:hypothetical protein